ncbi:polysaccharide pyruvyl transferase family protein [Cellulomonas palmilytica]|uniref:polysaccharide pyruvyl transferase family protein n=1 Tax=Cellulomonas palmilytica TaxID=2608402 RepID=UPI001F2CACFE|nr:polysaccharide pyruvyl transferase family protein [Cellulomonas palmilytica]UJP41013.1 polysaccharide pyruvyl transferase family protein [Cellulomonas palmilytica]
MLGVYWWSPLRSARTLAAEARSNAKAWTVMARQNSGRIYNFGDEIAPYVLRELTGEKVSWRPPSRADVFSVGSILEIYGKRARGAKIFGSGIRSGSWPFAQVTSDVVCSVRGTSTRDALGLPESTVLGDPGLAVAVLDVGTVRRTTRPAVVPHFGTFSSMEGRATLSSLRARGFDILLPNTNALDMVRRIAGASYVVTSSLHGLVFAHALGVPAVLTSFSGHAEPTFKYDDYMSVFGMRAEFRPVDSAYVLGGDAAVEVRKAEDAQRILALVPEVVEGMREASQRLVQ